MSHILIFRPDVFACAPPRPGRGGYPALDWLIRKAIPYWLSVAGELPAARDLRELDPIGSAPDARRAGEAILAVERAFRPARRAGGVTDEDWDAARLAATRACCAGGLDQAGRDSPWITPNGAAHTDIAVLVAWRAAWWAALTRPDMTTRQDVTDCELREQLLMH